MKGNPDPPFANLPEALTPIPAMDLVPAFTG